MIRPNGNSGTIGIRRSDLGGGGEQHMHHPTAPSMVNNMQGYFSNFSPFFQPHKIYSILLDKEITTTNKMSFNFTKKYVLKNTIGIS